MSLSGRTKNVLQYSMADRVAANELAAAVDVNAWATTAQELSPGASPSAAFKATLQVGDLVKVIDSGTGLTTYALVTTAGTVPGGLVITAGDLCIADRKSTVQYTNIVFPTDGSGYKDPDAVNYHSAEPSHKQFPTP